MSGYGKHYASMYEGSMYGSGSHVFAVWGYCISHGDPETETVTLNPVALANTIGDPLERIQAAITKLCDPDPHSRHKEEGGRRLIKIDEFDYRIVNFAYYRMLDMKEKRREYMRGLMAEKRALLAHPANSKLTNANPLCLSSASEKKGMQGETEVEFSESIPEPLKSNADFLKAWREWCQHRREIRKKLTPLAAQKGLKQLASWGPALAIQSIDTSIKNGWQGLFDPTKNGATGIRVIDKKVRC